MVATGWAPSAATEGDTSVKHSFKMDGKTFERQVRRRSLMMQDGLFAVVKKKTDSCQETTTITWT